jgi:uncharacterized membrane protein YfcA
MVPLLVLWAGLAEHVAHGTSLAAIIPTAVVGAVIYYLGGGAAVDLRFALFLTVGSVVGAYLGARAMARIPESALKIFMAALLAVVAVKEIVAP